LLLTLLQALQIILILKLTAHDLGLRPHSLQLLLQLLHCLVKLLELGLALWLAAVHFALASFANARVQRVFWKTLLKLSRDGLLLLELSHDGLRLLVLQVLRLVWNILLGLRLILLLQW